MNTGEITQTPTKTPPQVMPKIEPLEVLREVLDLARESRPELDVEGTMTFAVANPTAEVVDSLGAVTIVCVLFGAYEPGCLIPPNLLTHENFSTLNGLRKVVRELEKRQGKP